LTLKDMDGLVAYDSSEGEGEEQQEEEEASALDPEESSSVFLGLKEKFPLNSAPSVPVKVRSILSVN